MIDTAARTLTPVRAKRGRRTHARSVGAELELTVCNRPCEGWIISTDPIDCPVCKGRA